MKIFKHKLGFVAVALFLLLGQTLLEKELVLDANSSYSYLTATDAFQLGGTSSSSLETNDGSIILNCEIKKSDYAWPFCNITFTFYYHGESIVGDGLNFNDYEFMVIKAEYKNRKDLSLRLQMRAFDPIYAVKDNFESWKFMGIEFWPKSTGETVIPLDTLQVPSWWRIQNKIDVLNSGLDFDNVMVLELATGSNTSAGSYQIVIEEIKLVGRYISKERTYGIIVFLVVLVVIYMVGSSILDKSRLRRGFNSLLQTNKSLHTENTSLSALVKIDELTKTLNRRACFDIFKCKFDQLCVIFMDIDHFKSINDTHGHDVGDLVLQQFAKLVNANIRDRDFFIRWGGEEFLLISPDYKLSEAQDIADKLRQLMSEATWPNSIKLTCSFGVAQKYEDETVETVISRADKALYSAKFKGRNRVELSEKQNKEIKGW